VTDPARAALSALLDAALYAEYRARLAADELARGAGPHRRRLGVDLDGLLADVHERDARAAEVLGTLLAGLATSGALDALGLGRHTEQAAKLGPVEVAG
jgi:hypothetical protein